jgi:hypothetical protein
MNALRRICFLVVLFALALFGANPARADETAAVETAPHDMPLVLQPTNVTIPSILPDMSSRDHEWLKLAYPVSIESKALGLLEDADAFKAELSSWFGQNILEHVEVRLARSPEDMAALSPADHPPPRYATGVAYSSLHLVLVSLREPKSAEATDLREVLRHELVHVALWDATAGHHVPLWFNEGLAVFASGEHWSARMHALWNASLSKTILPLGDLDRGFPEENQEVSIAYAESADVVRFLLRDEDRARFGSLIERVRKGTPFERALTDAYGENVRKLEYEWREELDKRFSFWPVLTGSSMVWALIMGVLVIAWVKRRKKARETLAKWAKEEAEEDRQRAMLVEAKEPDALIVRRSIPTVQHDGEWHTLH